MNAALACSNIGLMFLIAAGLAGCGSLSSPARVAAVSPVKSFSISDLLETMSLPKSPQQAAAVLAQRRALADMSLASYYEFVLSRTSDAPLSVNGLTFTNLRQRYLASHDSFLALSSTYKTMGELLHYTEAASAPALSAEELASTLKQWSTWGTTGETALALGDEQLAKQTTVKMGQAGPQTEAVYKLGKAALETSAFERAKADPTFATGSFSNKMFPMGARKVPFVGETAKPMAVDIGPEAFDEDPTEILGGLPLAAGSYSSADADKWTREVNDAFESLLP